jgi:uncharacterized protein (DUF1778 family)
MLRYHSDQSLQGTKSARMELRTTRESKGLIEEAARLLGIKPSEFATSAAAKAARETLREHESTVLTEKDHDAFLRAWDATEPTDDLVRLMGLRTKIK